MQLMSIEDLAAYLGDSKRTIYKYIASGDCPPYIRISSKSIKFDRADVDAWLESKKVFPGPGGKGMSDLSITERARAALKNAVSKTKLPWTPRAQAVLQRAQKQARREGADVTGSEHVLFGITSVKDCLGAMILKNLGADPARCLELYEKLCKPSDQKGSGKARLGEDIDKIIQCAHEQAAEWGHEYIGAEHLLVGILRAAKGQGFRILVDLGITLDQVCEETERLIVCSSAKNERKEK
ncbi:MAG: helix-turn-helix domain-containing protein [Phycisphaerales bacterium]|nr:MAG: helix-turn-helix domain-containing protein [Phycisphaerales bacterium]